MNSLSLHIHLPLHLLQLGTSVETEFAPITTQPAAAESSCAAQTKPSRFTLVGNPPFAVIDHRTQLMWSRDTIAENVNWMQADAAAKGLRLGGHADWRLPTIKELLSIVDYSRHDPAIDTAFFNCESASYWASSPWAPSPADNAWLVLFSYGHSYDYGRDSRARVRAVRSVPAAGQ